MKVIKEAPHGRPGHLMVMDVPDAPAPVPFHERHPFDPKGFQAAVNRLATVADRLRALNQRAEEHWRELEERPPEIVAPGSYAGLMGYFERSLITMVLERAEGNVSAAARMLRMHRTTFIDRLEANKIDSHQFKRDVTR